MLEFAPILLVFFFLFYAIVSYALAMLIQQALTSTAAEGARAAVKVDPLAYTSAASYQNAARAVVQTVASDSLTWLPAEARAKVLGGVAVGWTPAGSMQVTITYAGYGQSPLVPLIEVPGIGKVPDLPDNLVGRAVVQPN